MLRRPTSRRAPPLWLPLALSLLAVACGGPEAIPQASGARIERTRELPSTGACLGRQRILEALGKKPPPAPRPVSRERFSTDPNAGALSPAEAYRQAAPGTVLIRTREGLGAGVVVDGSGLVVTNHHVVYDFQQPDLTMPVKLEFPDELPTGRMARNGKVYDAKVVKIDPVRDLAAIRIASPPPNLRPVRLSPADPQIGETVVSIGHPGVGLLWAAKTCTVSSIGDLTRDSTLLEAGDCTLTDLSDTPKEAARRKDQCEARKRTIAEQVASATQGVSVQTDCNVAFGDSGGPLLNKRGELVGLNQSLAFGGGTVAFHVHVAEVRAFLEDVGQEPIQVVPDPWCEEAGGASAEDMDGDGKVETVKLGFDTGPQSTFIDLNEDDPARPHTEGNPFAADVIVMRRGGGPFSRLLGSDEEVLAWYDTDGDGRLDVLLRDRESDGSANVGWRIDARGKYTRDPALEAYKTVDVTLLQNRQLWARLGVVAVNLGWTRFASEATLAAADMLTPPDIFAAGVQRAEALSPDGLREKPVEIIAQGALGSMVLVDVRSAALAALKYGDDARTVIERRQVAPQFVTLERPNGEWALYDTDDDGKLDLALFAGRTGEPDEFFSGPGYATEAVDLSGPQPKRVVAHLGRTIRRAKLIGNEMARRYAQVTVADDGRDSLPSPFYSQGRSPWHTGPLGTPKGRVLERADHLSAAALVDLKGTALGTATAEQVALYAFNYHVAFLRLGRAAWAFYDGDGDGLAEDVLFTRNVGKDTADAAFHVSREGDKLTLLDVPKGSIFTPERVTKDPKVVAALGKVWERVRAREGDTKKSP